jgi:type III secretory pathway component EscT
MLEWLVILLTGIVIGLILGIVLSRPSFFR